VSAEKNISARYILMAIDFKFVINSGEILEVPAL
jgi:hypothetical protein